MLFLKAPWNYGGCQDSWIGADRQRAVQEPIPLLEKTASAMDRSPGIAGATGDGIRARGTTRGRTSPD